jgi:nitrite reductase/ring-hydroxylating ferredoxin subunit
VVEIDGYRLAVFCVDGEPRVLDDECPHEGASLGDGVVQGGEVTCPWHGWHFRIADGRNTDGLAACVRVHVARAREDRMIEVALDEKRD